jgi:redox-sensitive bicupin YhaK (pirin superfamily)
MDKVGASDCLGDTVELIGHGGARRPMDQREVAMIVPTRTVMEGGGFPVRRPAAMGSLMSPFLLLDEMGPVDWAPGEAIGAPEHPHRGFETVTYMLEGRMKHGDNAGNHGDLNPGDVQWMTAGRGVIHEELPHPDFLESGGVMHGFQIWVNLPAAHKMMAPRYQDIPAAEIPTVEMDGVWARVIAGECLGVSAVIDTMIPISYIHVKMEAGHNLTQRVEAGLNGMIYVFGGSIKIGDKTVLDGQLALLSDGDEIEILSEEESQFLILAGPEIDEPIARYGPFVMNTDAEIRTAIMDFQTGRFA